MSSDDKALFEQVKDIITDFDCMIIGEPSSIIEDQWYRVLWKTIQIVRGGGGAAEVDAHLSQNGTRCVDHCNGPDTVEKINREYNERRKETTEKLVKLIREGLTYD